MNSILIIKPSSLGDIVHTLPAVASIRDAHPRIAITWVINPEFVPLLRGNSDVNHIHVFPRGDFRGLGAPASLLPWLKQTRKIRPDLALDFQGLLRSALIAGVRYGLSCMGCTVGLMVAAVIIGMTSLPWMIIISALVLLYKLAPPLEGKNRLLVSLTIAVLGILYVRLT